MEEKLNKILDKLLELEKEYNFLGTEGNCMNMIVEIEEMIEELIEDQAKAKSL